MTETVNFFEYSFPGPHEGLGYDSKAVGFRAKAREEPNQE